MPESADLDAMLKQTYSEVREYVAALKTENAKLQRKIARLEAENTSLENRIDAIKSSHPLPQDQQRPPSREQMETQLVEAVMALGYTVTKDS